MESVIHTEEQRVKGWGKCQGEGMQGQGTSIRSCREVAGGVRWQRGRHKGARGGGLAPSLLLTTSFHVTVGEGGEE